MPLVEELLVDGVPQAPGCGAAPVDPRVGRQAGGVQRRQNEDDLVPGEGAGIAGQGLVALPAATKDLSGEHTKSAT